MFNWVYFLVSGSKAFRDPLGVFKAYFIKDGAFDTAFITVLCISVVLCVIYYLITRKSMGFAKVWTWIVALVVAACMSFAVPAYTLHMDTTNQGIGKTLEVEARKHDDSQKQKQMMRKEFNKGVFRCSPVNTFCWTNFVAGGLIFFGASLLCKRFGGYGRHIPF